MVAHCKVKSVRINAVVCHRMYFCTGISTGLIIVSHHILFVLMKSHTVVEFLRAGDSISRAQILIFEITSGTIMRVA